MIVATNPLPEDPGGMLLIDFFETVYRPLRLIDCGRFVAETYQVSIRRLSDLLGRDALVSDLSEANVAAVMADMLARKMAPSTCNNTARRLCTVWRMAIRKKAWKGEDSPDAVDYLRVPLRQPTAWTLADMEALVKSARLATGRFLGVAAGKWWTALVLVAFDTGLRKSALFQIRFDEIDFDTHIMRVPAERMKNQVEQYYRLHHQTIEAILDTLPPKRGKVFPWPFSSHRALYRRFKAIVERAGLPFTKRDMFHRIRRTTASHIARAVGEAQAIKQLGHSNHNTIKRYIDPRFTAEHEGVQFLPRPAWDNPRQIVVEHVGAMPAIEPTAVRSVPLTQAMMRGEGRDLFAELAAKDWLTPEDVRDACDEMGFIHQDFASLIGVTETYFSELLNDHEKMSKRVNRSIRYHLGLCDERGRGVLCGREPL